MPKKSNKLQLKAKQEHETWLKTMNCHPEQLKSRKHYKGDSNKPSKYISDGIKTTNGFCDSGRVKGVFANLHNESEHTKKAILAKAGSCVVLYNKGVYGYPVKSDKL
jgi:hypothetical protein